MGHEKRLKFSSNSLICTSLVKILLKAPKNRDFVTKVVKLPKIVVKFVFLKSVLSLINNRGIIKCACFARKKSNLVVRKNVILTPKQTRDSDFLKDDVFFTTQNTESS